MNQLRAADLPRRAADALQSESASTSDRRGDNDRPENGRSVVQTVRGLFSPYSSLSRPMFRIAGPQGHGSYYYNYMVMLYLFIYIDNVYEQVEHNHI